MHNTPFTPFSSMSGAHRRNPYDSLQMTAGARFASPPSSVGSGPISPTGSVINSLPAEAVAAADTIDLAILSQVDSNDKTCQYIWSPSDASLYEVSSSRAKQAMLQPGSIKLVFPPRTMIRAWEKDGTEATPDFKPLHPHSNQW